MSAAFALAAVLVIFRHSHNLREFPSMIASRCAFIAGDLCILVNVRGFCEQIQDLDRFLRRVSHPFFAASLRELWD